jgi:hypothetical protein
MTHKLNLRPNSLPLPRVRLYWPYTRDKGEVEMKTTKMMLVVLAAGVSSPVIAQQNPLPSSGTTIGNKLPAPYR